MAEITNTYGSDVAQNINYTTSSLILSLPLQEIFVLFANDDIPGILFQSSSLFYSLTNGNMGPIVNFGTDTIGSTSLTSHESLSSILINNQFANIINFGTDDIGQITLSKNPAFVGASADTGGASSILSAYQFWS